MARYRGMLRAAVALVLFLPAVQRADAQDMLVIDSGGARWKSGEAGAPPVIVDFGVINALPAQRRPRAAQPQHQRDRRYLTLKIPQPPAMLVAPARPAWPAPAAVAEPEPQKPPVRRHLAAADLPARARTPPARARAPAPPAQPPAAASKPDPVAAPPLAQHAAALPGRRALPANPEAAPPARPADPAPPARPLAAAASKPDPVAAPPVQPAAAPPMRRLPAGKTAAAPPLQAFLDRAAGADAPAQPARAKLPPPPRPIQPGAVASAAAAPSLPEPGAPSRFRLPPPAPATGSPAVAVLSPAQAAGLPPPPPATGAPETRRRRLALDTAHRPAPAAPALQSETFLYETGGGAGLDPDAHARLRRLASQAAGATGLSIEIRAYAGAVDDGGAEARREALSRAMEVRRLLIAAGVPDNRIRRIMAHTGAIDEAPVGRVDVMLVERS